MSHIRKYGQGFYARFVLLVGLLSCLYVPATSQRFDINSCVTLMPTGSSLPQPEDSSPFMFFQPPTDYTPGVPIPIVWFSLSGDLFNNILIQARESGRTAPVGSFTTGNAYRYLDCRAGSLQGTVTNADDTGKRVLSTSYTPAAISVGDIEIIIVVISASNSNLYWEMRLSLSNTISPLMPCASNLCKNGGTCIEIPNGGYICLCRQDYTGETCSARIVNVGNLANGTFNLEDYLQMPITDPELVFLFTMVPINSIVDIYIGGDIGMFQIGNGNQMGVNVIIPGDEPIRVTGGEFWIQLYILRISAGPLQFRMLIYQFFIPFPLPFPLLPPLLPGVVYYFIQEVPPGGIVSLSGLNSNIRYGIGRTVGVNDVLGVEIRLTPYDTYMWYCVIGPLPTFRVDIRECSTDPCENNPCINFNSYCEPSATGCFKYICRRRLASECAACCPNPCWNNGLCEYDSTAIKLFSCQCLPPFTGPTCHEGMVPQLNPGDQNGLLPVFLPVWNTIYIHYTVADRNSGVRILVLRGFIARFGLGPEVKKNPVINVAALVFNVFNEFWVCLIPNGAIAEFTLEIFPRFIG